MQRNDSDRICVYTRGRVGIVRVIGPVFRYANWLEQMCRATIYDRVVEAFNKHLADPDIEAILLKIDSPEGEVNGYSDMGQMIFDARGRKPIVACVTGMACSTAYWLASACDKIVCGPTSELGSTGS